MRFARFRVPETVNHDETRFYQAIIVKVSRDDADLSLSGERRLIKTFLTVGDKNPDR